MGLGKKTFSRFPNFSVSLLLFFAHLISPLAQTQIALDGEATRVGAGNSVASLLSAIETSSTVTFGQERVWKMTGPFGGDVASLAVDPRDGNRLLVGTNDGQLFSSADAGVTWQRVKPGIKASGFALGTILFDLEKPNFIYIGAYQIKDAADDAAGGTIFVSENNGATWREVEALRGHSVRSVIQSAKDPNMLLVAARDGIYRTKDRCLTWERITPENDAELKNFHSVATDPRDANTIYVGTTHLPWQTHDGGLTWTRFGHKDNGVLDDSDIFCIRIDSTNPDTVFMSACSGIYKTLDAGTKWSKLSGIPFTSRRTHVIYQHPSRTEIVFAGTTEGLWRSIDSGQSWGLVSSRRQVINAVAAHPSQPDRIYIGTEDSGVMVSNDGGETFEPSNLGFINRQIRVVAHDRTERGRVYAGVIFDGVSGGFYLSEDNGLTWQQASRGMGISDVYSILQSAERPELLYAGTNHGLYRSEDRGLSWAKVVKASEQKIPVTQPANNENLSERTAPQVKNIVQSRAKAAPKKVTNQSRNQIVKQPAKKPAPKPDLPKDDSVELQKQIFSIAPIFSRNSEDSAGLIVATWDGLFITRDEKKGWKQLKFDNANHPYFNVVTTNPAIPGVILVGTEDGLYVSRDNGESFAAMPIAPTPRRVQSIVFDPREPATIYIGTNDGFFLTYDGGQKWEQRSNGLRTAIATSAVLVNPNNPDELYVGDQRMGGLFHSENKGKSWELIETSRLPSNRLWTISADPFDTTGICIGSFSGGVYVMNKQVNGRSRTVGQ